MTPHVIETIRQQIGTGISGGLAYVGADKLAYVYPKGAPRDCEYRPDCPSVVDPATGALKAEISLTFKVNATWTVVIAVAYEPDDTYTVRMFRLRSPRERMDGGPVVEVISERADVYCDELQGVVERMYDDYIREHQNGFIRVG